MEKMKFRKKILKIRVFELISKFVFLAFKLCFWVKNQDLLIKVAYNNSKNIIFQWFEHISKNIEFALCKEPPKAKVLLPFSLDLAWSGPFLTKREEVRKWDFFRLIAPAVAPVKNISNKSNNYVLPTTWSYTKMNWPKNFSAILAA